MATMQLESTQYVYFGVTGDVPSAGAEVAFLLAGIRPTTEWAPMTIVEDDLSPLWADAQASGLAGTYFLAILVGAFGTGGLELPIEDYQPWLRLTGTVEQVVMIAPQPLEVV